MAKTRKEQSGRWTFFGCSVLKSCSVLLPFSGQLYNGTIPKAPTTQIVVEYTLCGVLGSQGYWVEIVLLCCSSLETHKLVVICSRWEFQYETQPTRQTYFPASTFNSFYFSSSRNGEWQSGHNQSTESSRSEYFFVFTTAWVQHTTRLALFALCEPLKASRWFANFKGIKLVTTQWQSKGSMQGHTHTQ